MPDRVLVVVVEVDERSHGDRTTDNELLKLDKTRWGAGADKVVVVLRFNPDLQAGCAAALLDVRLPQLAARLRHYFQCPLDELDPIRCNVEYLYYAGQGTAHIEAARDHDNINVLLPADGQMRAGAAI